MAVNLDESNYFKFVIISDKTRSTKNKFTEKPSRDKDSMSTNSTNTSPTPSTPTPPTTTPPTTTPPTTTPPTTTPPTTSPPTTSPPTTTPPTTIPPTPPTTIPPTPPNNEKLDEKKQNSQETNKQTAPEVKLNNTPNGESTKEQKNEESTQITIEAPSKSTSPQLVTSPRELTGAKIPEPSITPTAQNSNILKSVGKKFGFMKNSSENGTVSDQEVVTSNSKMQQERQNVDNNVSNNNSTENTVNAARTYDENQKEDKDKKVTPETTAAGFYDENQKEDKDKKVTPETTAKKKNSIANMKSFITRTSSVFVEKIQEKFDNLDRHIYPDIDPNYENKLSREVGTSEREQLLENKDVEVKNDTSQKSQTIQSTQNVLAEVGVALNERKEKLDGIAEKTEKLSNSSSNFLELAKQLSKEQEQKNNKFWKLW